MTGSISGEADLRHWLIDYLVTNIGCTPDEVDPDLSLADLGVSSRDAVVLSGELSELLGRTVSPIDFWEHPTINALAAYLAAPEPSPDSDAAVKRGARNSLDEPIAVVGMGCRFPGGISCPEALWDFLCERRSSISQVPPQRWQPFEGGPPEVAAALARTTRWGSFLPDIDAFDAEFFEISPSEADKMDPQQRLLLEVAWEALEHAGIPPGTLRRSATGVFAGACLSEYGAMASADLSQVDGWSNSGGAMSIIANRLSYFLDLRGPSVAVDTACSSSLVAIHLACQSLRTQDCHLAIAAGVNLLLSPAVFRGFDQVRRIIAAELRVPEKELDTDRPFAELGLNSLMAMAIRREAEQFVGIELSATMLFNHPTVKSLASYLAKRVAPHDVSQDNQISALSSSAGSVLDSLFDRIESAPPEAERSV